ncbi:MAG: translocation/assembly module TamB domain-containing protein [Candidatus Cyclobacteriaceae bacterium M3_2C_046]
MLGWIIVSVLGLILLVFVALQFPPVQNILSQKAEQFLQKKLPTKVRIGGIGLDFFNAVSLKDIYIEDLDQDTLLYADQIEVAIDYFGLLRSEIDVAEIDVDQLTGHISRPANDSAFNFNFIIEAFSSDSTQTSQTTDTTSSPWTFSLGELNLMDVYFTYEDQLTGNLFKIKLGQLQLEMDQLDLQNNEYLVEQINLKNTSGYFGITKLVPPDTTSSDAAPINLGLNELLLTEVQFEYENQPARQSMQFGLEQAELRAQQFDLSRQIIDLNKFELENTHFAYIQNRVSLEDSVELAQFNQKYYSSTDDEYTPPWQITAEGLEISNSAIQLVNHNYEPIPQGIDFNHLNIHDLDLVLDQVKYEGLDISARIEQFNFSEQSGFTLEKFTAGLSIDSTQARLEDLDLVTGHSHLQRLMEIQYQSFETLGENIGDIGLNLDLNDTRIGVQDILYFAPDMANMPPFEGNTLMSIKLNTRLTGQVSDLSIHNLRISTLGNTILSTNGFVKGLPQTDDLYLDFPDIQLVSTDDDLGQLFLPDSIRQQYNIPARLNVNASFTGSLKDFSSKLDFNSSLGDVLAEFDLEAGDQYRGMVQVDSFQLGTFMRNDTVYGPVSLQVSVDGQGFQPDTMNTHVDLLIKSAEYQKYTYDSLTLEGDFKDYVFNGTVAYKDENLHFDLDGAISLNPEDPRYEFTLDVTGADLHDLNLVSSNLVFRGVLKADLTGNNLNTMNGDVGIRNVLVIKNGESYRVDSLLFASLNEEGKTDLSLESDILSATFTGNVNIGDLVPVMERHISNYYTLHDKTAYADTLRPQNFEFEIDLKNPEILTEVLIPPLDTLIPGQITGSFNSIENNLEVNILIPKLIYSGIEIDTLTFYANSDQDQLNYALSLSDIIVSGYEIRNFAVVGQILEDQIETRLQITDEDREEKYAMGGVFKSIADEYRFTFDPPEILLNYNNWNVADSNYFAFGGNLMTENMIISRDEKQIAINTQVSPDSILQIAFDNFNLRTLSNVFVQTDSLVVGLVNGQVEFDQTASTFTSDITINDLVIRNGLLGDLELVAQRTSQGVFEIDASVTGNQNDIQVNGNYTVQQEAGQLDFEVDLNNMNLNAFEGVMQGIVSDLNGAIEGNLQLSGTTSNYNLDGNISFEQANFTVDYLKAPFSVNDERIVFNQQGISFNNFTLQDNNNNDAVLDGMVYTDDYRDFNFDLSFEAEDFMALNTTRKDNEMYFGKVVMDALVQITGSMNQPDISLDLVVEEETSLTYLVPESETGEIQMEGLVRFIDRDNNLSSIIVEAQKQDYDTLAAELTGMDLNANIEIDQNAELKIIIDNAAGDFLRMQAGASNLSLNIDPVGNINLTGVYEIYEGVYQLTFYDLVKRSFNIQQGSSIRWTGNPLDAIIDITAIYTVDTSPQGLIRADAGLSAQQTRQLNKRLPFQVHLGMEGNLMTPEIGFEIELAEEATGTLANQARSMLASLNKQDSELNKQVFALLILQRFIQDNPLDTEGGGIASTARSSVSKILTQQLNRLGENIGGVQLSFDVQSYEEYETGQGRTELEVALSKNLFDDRLSVQVGGNIDIEDGSGQRQQQQNDVTNYIGDIQIQYKLTEDGRFLLEFFREDAYETMIEQEIMRTGIGIIFTRDYNKLEQLFTKPEEEEE